jgi:hypothetical protein
MDIQRVPTLLVSRVKKEYERFSEEYVSFFCNSPWLNRCPTSIVCWRLELSIRCVWM